MRSKKQEVTPKVTEVAPITENGSEDGWARLRTPSPMPLRSQVLQQHQQQQQQLQLQSDLQQQTITTPPPSITPAITKKNSLKRLQQIQERNKHLPPHMRSSYVVEEFPGLESSICDESHVNPEKGH